jgi:Leucine-rich repeat (LRR) protein
MEAESKTSNPDKLKAFLSIILIRFPADFKFSFFNETKFENQVRKLNLAQNKIALIPEWCDDVSKSYVPNLRTLHFTSNYITRIAVFK